MLPNQENQAGSGSLPVPDNNQSLADFIMKLEGMISSREVVFQPCPECVARGGCSGDCGVECRGIVAVEVKNG